VGSMKGKVVVLTGGAGDICAELALHFLRLDGRVAVLDIDSAKLDSLASRADEYDDSFFSQACDATDVDQLSESIRASIARFGAIDVLINGVGGTELPTMRGMTVDGWRREVEVNLNTAAYSSILVLPVMRRQMHGSIINISSVNAFAVFGSPAYSAAKAGLLSLTRSIAVEYGAFGIRCNALCLGTVSTKAWSLRVKNNPQIFGKLGDLYSIRRVATPRDLLAIIDFMAGDGSETLNGSVLTLDGGLTAGIPSIASAFIQDDL
jgi:NAD(P)-dependent dehydrogenase (short-subunit alcohol dehydrogenase family)